MLWTGGVIVLDTGLQRPMTREHTPCRALHLT
jgi:hypothetical protein